jgi:hypothetical protein
MTHVEANDAALDAMRLLDPLEPVVMLNLLRFRDVALDGFGVDGMTGSQAFRLLCATPLVNISSTNWTTRIIARFQKLVRLHFSTVDLLSSLNSSALSNYFSCVDD